MSSNFVDYGNATALMGGVADRIDKDKFIGTRAEWNRLTQEEKAVYDGRVVNITDDFTPGGGGGGGTYTAGNGINIDANNVISSDSVIFTGTKSEWDALTLEEKIQYTHAAWVGDEQSGAIDPVPTEDSNNLMTSGGIFNALENKADTTAATKYESISVTGATSPTTAIGLAWDGITDVDRVVTGRFFYEGWYIFVGYKYASTNYGMMMVQQVNTNIIYTLQVNNGTKTVKTLQPTTDSVTSGSSAPLSSGGAYTALNAKQDKLTNPLTKSDVVNNLTTTTTNVPLSAAQGKVLNDKIPYVGNYPSFVHQSFLNNTSMSFTINPNLGAIVIIQNTTAAAIVSVSGMYGSFHQIKIAGTFTNYTISAPDDKTVTVSTPDVVTVTIIGLISA